MIHLLFAVFNLHIILIFNPRSVSLWFTDRKQTTLSYYAHDYTFISLFFENIADAQFKINWKLVTVHVANC